MKNRFIPVNEPLLDGNEHVYVSECIRSGWISSEGAFVSKFENLMAARVARKHAVCVSNGTTALDIAIQCLDLGPGDEVIVPTFTIISCLLQIVRTGATPVLVDCCPLTWNMDVAQIESVITKKTKAIMVVHIYGLPVNMGPVLTLCQKYDLKLIEDAAEAIGQLYDGKPCGSFGDISTMSFYSNKHVTTGEGGMILTDSDEIASRARQLRNLCFVPDTRFVHYEMGWNARMTNLQAAIGCAQLEKLDDHLLKKRNIGRWYTDRLSDLELITLPQRSTGYAENVYWVFGVVLSPVLGLTATCMMDKLHHVGIGTRPFFCPMHLQPVFNNMGLFIGNNFPISEEIYKFGFYLPSGLSVTEDEVDYVCVNLKRILYADSV